MQRLLRLEEIARQLSPERLEELQRGLYGFYLEAAEAESSGFTWSVPSREICSAIRLIADIKGHSFADSMFFCSDSETARMLAAMQYYNCRISETGIKLSKEIKNNTRLKEKIQQNSARIRELKEKVEMGMG